MEFVTPDEKTHLEAKLRTLVENRPVLSKRIAEARELGDLRENAEYHAAREDQGLQEAEIRRLEERLSKVQVVGDQQKGIGVVFVGATVRIQEVGSDEIETFRLVGEHSGGGGAGGDVVEATVSSPFGEALHKARIGEVIAVRGPRGIKRFEIKEIL